MANELDKTIEELEAEVLDELEEASSDPMQKLKKNKEDGNMTAISNAQPEGKVQTDATKAVNDPDDALGAKAAKATKKDTTIPQKGGQDKMDAPNDGMKKTAKSLAAGYNPMAGYSDDEIRELCHSADHDCATFVEHPVFGKGKPIKESHAIPDKSGYVAWYDVQFKHGVEEKVMAEDMKILATEGHHEDKKMTKGEMINAMKDMMMGMHKEKKDQIMATYNAMNSAMHEMGHEETEEEKEKKESVEKRLKSIDVSEHVNALMTGEGDLSEEFKRKAATVFEAAVKSKVRSEVERMEDEYKSELEENINATKEELTEKVDSYMNYVVEEWMKENELAIERGLKGEIAEDFISGLKQLFEDHYVDVPDEKYDVLGAQSEKISELEGRINEMMEEQIQSKSVNATLVKEQVLSALSSDLAETEIEKFKSLIEDVDFTTEESYREKLGTLKESYFPKSAPVVTEAIDDVETGIAQDIDTSDSMAAYMSAIGRTVNSAK
jgi:hypothetical protein